MDLKILEIASNTENNKVIDNFTHRSKNKNPICGDEMEISLIVKNDKVVDMGYQCNHVFIVRRLSVYFHKKSKIKNFINSCESVFENTKIVLEKNWKEFLELLNKKNVSRKECLLLPLRTVLKALKIS